MEEYPHCPICLDIFGSNKAHIKAPKILKCGDSVCRECLQKMIKETLEEYFLCPTCKEKIKKEQSVDDYTTVQTIINIVNTYFNIPEKEIENLEDKNIINYNIVLLGNCSVGKTCIFQRLLKDIFSESLLSTTGLELNVYYIKYKNKKYKLIMNDTAGQERYKAITKSLLRGKDGVLFIYDISDEKSFNDLKSWYDLYKEENDNVVGLLIGNKCDCERKVNEEDAKKFADEHGLKYIETSAKLDINIKKAIATILEEIIKSKNINREFIKIDNISLMTKGQKKKGCGC